MEAIMDPVSFIFGLGVGLAIAIAYFGFGRSGDRSRHDAD
jgi:hypothetical protein